MIFETGRNSAGHQPRGSSAGGRVRSRIRRWTVGPARTAWLRAAAALVVLLAAGCSGSAGGPSAAAAVVAPLEAEVFSIGYSRIADIYLDPVAIDEIGLRALGGLRALDAGLSVDRVGRELHLVLDGRRIGMFPIPGADDATGWADLTIAAIDRARRFSGQLRGAAPDRIYQAVFDAVLAHLDAYSRYSGPKRASSERAERDGFGGIGAAIDCGGGACEIRAIDPDAPAAAAGIRVGDRVYEIDGAPVGGGPTDDIVARLRGPVGTRVRLTVGPRPMRELVLRRDRVIPNTVSLVLGSHTAVIRITRFNAATTSNLRTALAEVRRRIGSTLAGLILDLRGNPGGLLDQAVEVADLFLRRGRIVSTAGRHPDSWQRFDADGDDLVDGLPMVVLLDGRSASASEIVAAALQDSRRAVVVGASSFGKGSVQTVTRLPNDAELFLTWSRLYAPSGYTLHRQGVQPTICTSKGGDDPDSFVRAVAAGGLTAATASLRRWRTLAPDDEQALARLRAACPWKAHAPELDVAVAERLVRDRRLYFSAINTTAVAER